MNVDKLLFILIAEDDEADRYIITKAFQKSNQFWKIQCVKNGEELVRFLEDSKELPDIVLADINMPRINGLEALQIIRSKEELHCLPFVIFTTSSSQEDKRKATELGADAFWTKPMLFAEFIEIAGKLKTFIPPAA